MVLCYSRKKGGIFVGTSKVWGRGERDRESGRKRCSIEENVRKVGIIWKKREVCGIKEHEGKLKRRRVG